MKLKLPKIIPHSPRAALVWKWTHRFLLTLAAITGLFVLILGGWALFWTYYNPRVPLADPLVVNEHEARAVGIDADATGGSLDAWREAAASAVDRVARSVVVTLGSAGAVAASRDGSWAAPAPTVEAVDTTGAGDGFTGALAAFLAEGRALEEALRIAVAAGALAVQARGTVDSYATRDAVLGAAGLTGGGARA